MTPAAALRDPELAFNISVMRGYLTTKRIAEEEAPAGDPITTAIQRTLERED